MAVALTRLVWKLRMPTGRKMVLLALADTADNDGVCWPRLDTLSEMTSMAESTVSEHVSALVADGYVERRRRRQQSAVCTVLRARLAAGQDFPNQEISNQEVKGEDFGNQEVSSDQDFLIPPLKTSGSRKSLKGTTREPPITSAKRADDEHPEASKLCDRLAELMVANGCKQPTIGKRWLDAARLLLDRDGRTFPEALAVLEWTQADDFEQANIHSMPKFRQRYDQLRLKARRAGALTARSTPPATEDDILDWLRGQWDAAKVSAIESATGLRYEQPDLPLDVDLDGADEFYRQARRDWIEANRGEIVRRITKGVA